MKILFRLGPYNQQRQFEKPVWVYPAHLAMYATYLRNQGHEVVWGTDGILEEYHLFNRVITDDTQIDVPFEKLPFPDRVFTRATWKEFQKYGNYKFHPATHMMASNLCWYGKCTFCIDTAKLEAGEKRGLRSVGHVMEEIEDLVANGYREVFDDSGTFPVGGWLDEFLGAMHGHGLRGQIKIGCNMKPIKNLPYQWMADCGFRFILVGVESANQDTLDRIKKGQRAEDVIPAIKAMSDAGLEPHLTTMFGYPWESHEDAMRTVKLVHYLLKKGYAKTAQASVYSLPRTKPDPLSTGHKYVPMIYDAYKSPQFWFHKIMDLRRWEDFTYLMRGARLVVEEKWRKAFAERRSHRTVAKAALLMAMLVLFVSCEIEKPEPISKTQSGLIVYDNGLDDWAKDSNSEMGQWFAKNSRIVQDNKGWYVPQFNVASSNAAPQWEVLFADKPAFDDLKEAQWKLRYAFLFKKAVCDGLHDAFKSVNTSTMQDEKLPPAASTKNTP